MNTFRELQQKFTTASFRAAIYTQLINHIESEFRSVAGNQPKKVLMTDEKIKVPDDMFEQVVKELHIEFEAVNKEIEQIMSSQIQADSK